MTDEIKLLTDQRSPSKKWADQFRHIDFASGGVITPRPYQEEMMRALLDDRVEAVVMNPPYSRGRMHRYGEAVTGRFSGRPTFMMTIRAVDRMTQGFRAATDAMRRFSDTMHYGPRIAKLLNSTDPRQRKRGKRLRDKRMSVGTNWTELEARALVQDFRDEYPGLKRFYDTQLGEPYDPARYRKD